MEKGLKGKPAKSFKKTENVIGVNVNPVSGKLATKDCPVSRMTYYVKGTEPVEYCAEHFKGENPKHAPKKEEHKKAPWYKKVLKPWG
jgi:membrane carboxypeptidase/penicillin-binding protein